MFSKRTGPVAGIVLAAGTSTRMGRNKLLLELDGEPLLRRAVRRAIEAGLDPVIVVVGFESDRVRETLSDLPYHLVLNTAYEEGINRSARLGISQVPEPNVAAVIMLPDMPFVTTKMIKTLVERYRDSTAPLVISRYGDVNAPPMLHDRSLFAEFQGPDSEGCGKHIVRRHRDEAEVVEWPADALQDLDVPDDYERVRAQLAGPVQ